MPRRRHSGGEGVVRPGLGGPLGGGGRAGILDLGEERAVARGTVVAVGGSAMGATASSLASCRGQGCSNSGSSARRRGETRIGLGEDEDGLSSYGATAQRTGTATACGGVSRGGAPGACRRLKVPGESGLGENWGREGGLARGAARGRPEDGAPSPTFAGARTPSRRKNREGREMEMVVMAVL